MTPGTYRPQSLPPALAGADLRQVKSDAAAQTFIIWAEALIKNPHDHTAHMTAARNLSGVSLPAIEAGCRWPLLARHLWDYCHRIINSQDAAERDAMAGLAKIIIGQRFRLAQSPPVPPPRPRFSD